jgi:hypothetical protein
MKPYKQTQATNYIKNLLTSRNINIEPGIVLLGSDEAWQVFEYQKKCIGIDPSANVWIGPSGGEWTPLGECTVSGALQAIEFLTKTF